MKYAIRAQARFSTTHMSDEPVRCQMLHGHDFAVTAEYAHELLDDGVPRGGRDFDRALRDICAELDERPLDEMAPGVNQTHVGLAAYIFERLAAKYPSLTAVQVRDERSYAGTAFA